MTMLQLHVGDFGKDPDDEVAALVAAHLHAEGSIELAGTVANLDPPVMRARLARGTYTSVGLDVPVAAGTDCGWREGVSRTYQFDAPYLAEHQDIALHGGAPLFRRLAERAASRQLHLVLMSGFTDGASWAEHWPGLFGEKVGSVTLMTGADVVDGRLRPRHTSNSDFDYPAACHLFEDLQRMRIPMTVLAPPAAYAAAVPKSFFTRLAETGHPAGVRLAAAQRASMDQFWAQCCLDRHHPDRTLPWGDPANPRTGGWFRATFCGGDGAGVGPHESIWPFVRKLAQYDALTVLASHPVLRDRFFEPAVVDVDGVAHRLVGEAAARHGRGVKDPEALVAYLTRSLDSLLRRTAPAAAGVHAA